MNIFSELSIICNKSRKQDHSNRRSYSHYVTIKVICYLMISYRDKSSGRPTRCKIVLFFFLDTITFQFWEKQRKAVTNFYNVSVANRSSMRKRLCQLPVSSLPVSSLPVSSYSKRFWVWKSISFHRFEKIPWNFRFKFIFC